MENVKLIKKLLDYPMDADIVIAESQSYDKPIVLVVEDAFNDEVNTEIDLGSL